MKILLVSELLPFKFIGGLAIHTFTLANHLQEIGHDVAILGNADFPFDNRIEFKGKFIQGFRLNWSVAEMLEESIGIFPAPLYNNFSKRIADAINKVAGHYDVIHYHGHYPMVANFISKDINFVQTRHDHGTFCPNKYFFRFSNGRVCTSFAPEDCAYCFKSHMGFLWGHINKKWCSAWRDDISRAVSDHKTIFVSEYLMKMSLNALGINRTPAMTVIHNFIDTKAILSMISKTSSNKNISSARDNKVMIASVLHIAKGVYSFLRVYKKKGYNFSINIAGIGVDLRSMRKEFEHYPVNFLGWLPHEDALKLMSLHQVFLVTSLVNEPCATTLLEAMFLNKHIFALKRGGMPELKTYSRYETQLNLFDSMDELVDGIANYLDNQSTTEDIDIRGTDFGACVSKKALEIISVYNL